MQVDSDLYTFLSEASNAPVEQGKISEDKFHEPCIWFNRIASTQTIFLGGQRGLWDSNFDVEVYGADIDAVENLAAFLLATCNGFQGMMGETYVYAMFCADHEEDYVPKVAAQTDDGLNVSSFNLQIVH